MAAGSRFSTIDGLLAHAKAHPGQLNVGTINIGSTQHLSAELLKTSAGLDFQVVPFNGTPAVLNALRAGQVDACVEILAPMLGQVRAGTVRALAVLGERRAARHAILRPGPHKRPGRGCGQQMAMWGPVPVQREARAVTMNTRQRPTSASTGRGATPSPAR